MKAIKGPVILITLVVLLFAGLVANPATEQWTMLIFSISPVLVIWLVYSVLRYGEDSPKRFDEGHWYEDLYVPEGKETGIP